MMNGERERAEQLLKIEIATWFARPADKRTRDEIIVDAMIAFAAAERTAINKEVQIYVRVEGENILCCVADAPRAQLIRFTHDGNKIISVELGNASAN